MSAQYGLSAAEAAYAEAAAAESLVMPKAALIPVGTIALCLCRRVIQVISHDRRNRPYWTHMGESPMHYPSPLGYKHDLSTEEVQIVLLRRENKKLSGAIESIRELVDTGLGKPLHHIVRDVQAIIERIEAQ